MNTVVFIIRNLKIRTSTICILPKSADLLLLATIAIKMLKFQSSTNITSNNAPKNSITNIAITVSR